MKAIVLIVFTFANVTMAGFTPFPPGAGGTSAGVSSFVGEIRSMHTFNGTIAVPKGWMQLNGDVVDQTNYDAIHGAGAYVTDGVGTSPLVGKNLPNFINKYEVAANTTTQDGSVAITSVGNSSNQVDIRHSHGGAQHNHQWYNYVSAGSGDQTYASNGTATSLSTSGANKSGGVVNFIPMGQNGAGLFADSTHAFNNDAYTDNSSGTTGNAGSTTQTIQPESIEVIKIMKVI